MVFRRFLHHLRFSLPLDDIALYSCTLNSFWTCSLLLILLSRILFTFSVQIQLFLCTAHSFSVCLNPVTVHQYFQGFCFWYNVCLVYSKFHINFERPIDWFKLIFTNIFMNFAFQLTSALYNMNFIKALKDPLVLRKKEKYCLYVLQWCRFAVFFQNTWYSLPLVFVLYTPDLSTVK